MPAIEGDSMFKIFESEVARRAKAAAAKVVGVQNELRGFLQSGAKAPTKKEIESLLNRLNDAGTHFEGGSAVVLDAFNEAMEKSVADAKSIVNAHVSHVVEQTGLAVIRDRAPLIEGPSEN
jgi:hypothetical protein